MMRRQERTGSRNALVMASAGVIVAIVVLVAVPLFHPVAPTVAGAPSRPIADFSLLDQEGRHHQLSRYAGSRAVVIFVHGVGCNIARDSIPALKQLEEHYTVRESDFMMPARRREPEPGKGLLERAWRRFGYEADRFLTQRWLDEKKERDVVFLMLNANPQDDRESLRRDARAYNSDIPILEDDTQLVAQALDIHRTGEAIVIDTRTWQVAYRGPVDDRLGVEARKQEARHHYLGDAIESIIHGRAVAPSVPPIGFGCAITEIPRRAVSYAREVAPLLIEKCVPCHQPGGVAPWSMDRYQTVKGWSAMMREVLANRRMPPWHADPAIGRFKNDRSLGSDQIRMLVDWIDAGAARGDGSDPLAARAPGGSAEWPLGPPDIIVEAPRQEIPATGMLDYRYVDVPLTIDRDVWVRAVHLKPGNPAVVHHEFAFLGFPAGTVARQPDFKLGVSGFFAAYAPGFDVEPFPQNSGQFLPKGTVIEFQQHYAPLGKTTSDTTRLGIYLHHRPPPRELIVASAANQRLRIPPLVADHPAEASFVFDRDVELHALFPHMHVRGSRVSVEADYPDGRSEMLLSVPRYAFNWQGLYAFRAPLRMPAMTRIVVGGAFNNSPLNPSNPDPSKAVYWGEQSSDEMFTGYLLYTVPLSGADATPSSGMR